MGFQTFKAKLKTILDGLVSEDETQPFAISYGFATSKMAKMPAVCVYRMQGGKENQRFQTHESLLTMPYVIRAFYQADNTEETETAIEAALDKTLKALRSTENYGNLGGVVDVFEIVSIDPIGVDEPEPMVGFQIIVAGSQRIRSGS